MTRPIEVPFSGRARWGEVLVDLVLSGLGGVLLLAATPEDTGEAITDGLSSAGETIGGWFS